MHEKAKVGHILNEILVERCIDTSILSCVDLLSVTNGQSRKGIVSSSLRYRRRFHMM